MPRSFLPPGYRVYPAPVVIVSCGDAQYSNLITCAWSGSVNMVPPTVYVSIHRDRFSHHIVEQAGEFVINLCSESMLRAADVCGRCSGRDTDKWAAAGLSREKARFVSAPLIKESPLSLECRVTQTVPLGTHDMFLGEVLGISADSSLLDEKGRLRPENVPLLAMAGGSYLTCTRLAPVGFTAAEKE